MSGDHQKFEAKVRAEWMDPATAEAWRKWHDKSVRYWQELTDALFEVARLQPGQCVLDLASGTGDPAIVIAQRVAPGGRVVITDIAPQMTDIARENAATAGVTNVSFDVMDAHTMPYPDASFDRVTCRLGVMFFWDCGKALGEIRRVLKPGGVASFIAWGPAEQNEYVRTAMGPFKRRAPMPPSAPGTPEPDRFARPGSLSAELRAAGFQQVHEAAQTVKLSWPGRPAELWQRMYEIAAPMRPYFNSFAAEVRDEAVKEVIAGFTNYSDGREVVFRAPIVVASAVK
jgi:SAM-dependent methyltransferase